MKNLKANHILIVDDEEELNRCMVGFLKEKGYSNVHSAFDGEECLEVMEQLREQVYVISLDLKMPKMDGFEVMRRLARTQKQVVGVVMVTGFNDLKAAMKFKQLGTDTILSMEYITLPCDFEEWAKTIDRTTVEVNDRRRQYVVSSELQEKVKTSNADVQEFVMELQSELLKLRKENVKLEVNNLSLSARLESLQTEFAKRFQDIQKSANESLGLLRNKGT